MKKEEMIRHFKWHKKRDESLTHGFLRCSPGDNCIERFKHCPHHRKQTHYHCLKRGCDKVGPIFILFFNPLDYSYLFSFCKCVCQPMFLNNFHFVFCCFFVCNPFYWKLQVYISTSDVQMHANYHRKDTAIIQEGFQRFRATENCLLESCAFFGQKTTHFHCRRDNCKHTFKNKADMGKLVLSLSCLLHLPFQFSMISIYLTIC